MLEPIAVGYRRMSKLVFEAYPSLTVSTCVVNHTEISVLLDNEALFEIYQKQLDNKRPPYDMLNRLLPSSHRR